MEIKSSAELSRDLALALGYFQSVRIYAQGTEQECCQVYRAPPTPCITWPLWMKFDYRDPTVVVPLIEWLAKKGCLTIVADTDNEGLAYAVRQAGVLTLSNNLAEAIARAVIAIKKGLT